MPVLTPYAPDTFVGDGVSTTFPITFDFQFFSDLALTTTVVATGVVTPLVYGTSYSVSPQTNSPASTGSVTLFAALPVGTNLTVSRAVPITQDTTWIPNDPNPSTSTQNAVDKLTLIAQDLEYQVLTLPTGGGANVVTTAIFAMAAIGSPNTIVVSSVDEFSVGNTIQVSNSALTLVAQITAINPATLTLTATTLAIVAGTPGTNMPVGAAVQLGAVPANNTILVGDAVNPPQAVSKIEGVGDPTAVNSFGTQVDLYVASYAGNAATVRGILNYVQGKNITATNNLTAAPHPAVLAVQQTDGFMSYLQSTATGGVLRYLTSSTIGFSLLDATNVTPGSLTPALLQATNSPTDTFVPTYNAATQKFTWAAGGSGTVPGGGNSSQFLRGDVAWSHTLVQGVSNNPILSLANTTSAYVASFVSLAASGFQLQFLTPASNPDPQYAFLAPNIWTTAGQTYIDTQPAAGTTPTETGVFANIIRAGGMRTLQGPWQKIQTINAPAASVSFDIVNGMYYRLTGLVNNVTITAIVDTTTQPISQTYAAEAVFEINAPGAFTITWPATVTWAGGASAPTLSTTGVNVIKLIRRQGQTQWIGYTETQSSATTYTDAQARSAVLSSTYLLPSATINWAISAGVSAAPSLIAGSITGTYLAPGAISSSGFFGIGVIPNTAIAAGTISTNKLNLPGGTAVYMDGTGNFTTPAGGGSGGVNVNNLGIPLSGGPFTTLNLTSNLTATNAGAGTVNISAAAGGTGVASPNAFVITWNGAQTWTSSSNLFTNTTSFAIPASAPGSPLGTSAADGGFGQSSGLDGSSSGLYVHLQDRSTGGNFHSGFFWHDVLSPGATGCNGFEIVHNPLGNISSGFQLAATVITTARQVNTGGTSDAVWLNSGTPDSFYQTGSGHVDAAGFTHSFGSGFVRIGECNYGNAWADTGLLETRVGAGATPVVAGLEFFPAYIAGPVAGTSPGAAYDVNWAIAIGFANPNNLGGHSPQNHVGILIDQNGVSPNGIALRLWGSNGTFNGASATTNAPQSLIKMSGTTKTGMDTSPATIVAETVSGHSNTAAIIMAQGQAICFAAPTGANTGVYIVYDGTHLKATINGGNTFTTIV